MSKLTAADRRAMPASEFAGPGRSFPIPDKGHARAALQDLPKSEAKGNISPSAAAHVRAVAHAKLADHHLALHTMHSAVAEHHDNAGSPELGGLHRAIAGHHLGIAEHHNALHEDSAADKREDARGAKEMGISQAQYENTARDKREDKAGADHLAIGASRQLHRKGLISDKQHAEHVRKLSGNRSKPFGSLSGAGHYQGDVDMSDSPGTNAGM